MKYLITSRFFKSFPWKRLHASPPPVHWCHQTLYYLHDSAKLSGWLLVARWSGQSAGPSAAILAMSSCPAETSNECCDCIWAFLRGSGLPSEAQTISGRARCFFCKGKWRIGLLNLDLGLLQTHNWCFPFQYIKWFLILIHTFIFLEVWSFLPEDLHFYVGGGFKGVAVVKGGGGGRTCSSTRVHKRPHAHWFPYWDQRSLRFCNCWATDAFK